VYGCYGGTRERCSALAVFKQGDYKMVNKSERLELIREAIDKVKRENRELWEKALKARGNMKNAEQRKKDWEKKKKAMRVKRRKDMAQPAIPTNERDYYFDGEGEFTNSSGAKSKVDQKGQYAWPTKTERTPCGRRDRGRTCKIRETGESEVDNEAEDQDRTTQLQDALTKLLDKYARLKARYEKLEKSRGGMSYADCLKGVNSVIAASDGKLK